MAASEDSIGQWPRGAAVVAGALAAATGLFTLAARLSGRVALLAIPRGARPMAAWASLELILAAAGILVVALTHPRHRLRAFASGASVLLIASAFLCLAGHLGVCDLACPLTMPALFFSGAALLVLARGTQARLAGVFGLVPAGLSAAICLGFAYGVPLIPPLGRAPSIFAAAGVFFLGCGFIAAAGPSAWPLRALCGDRVRAVLLRWFMPFTLLAVVGTDFLTVRVFARFSPALGSTVNATVSLAAAAAVTWFLTDLIGGRVDRAEQRMEESESRFRSLIENASILLTITDAEGTIAYTSPSLVRLLGFESEAWRGKRIPCIADADDRPALERLHRAILAGERADAVLCRLRHRAGRIRTFEVAGCNMTGVKGVGGLVFTARDVTERQALKQHLRTNEELFRVAFQTSPDAMNITRLEDGAYVAVNRGFMELTGWPESEAVGRTSAQMAFWVDRDKRAEALQRLAREGTVKDLEARLRRRDGSEFVGQMVVQSFQLGGRTHLLTVTRDVTAQRKLERETAEFTAALRRAGDEWRTTFDSVDGAVMVIDPAKGTVTRMNLLAAQLAGRRPQDRPSLQELQNAEPWRTIAQALPEVRGHCHSVLKNATDHRTTWLVACSRPQPWPGAGEAVVVLVRDVSEVVALRDGLRRSEAMSAIGSLVSGVAHQVRNPIFGMNATLDAMEARFGADRELEPFQGALRRELDRVGALMRDLLQYGRPSEVTLAPGLLAPVVTLAARCCAPAAELASIRIDNRVGPEAGSVAMDEERLAQVFQNLIENAIQHSPAGGVVVVDARRVERHVEVRVLDSGTGFRSADLPRVFEPFFTRRRGGTGLGLSIVQRIVEQHGGAIEAANRPEGGASVTVRLPGTR